ncbi:hypothetical protein C723_3525 [Christiangramia flava JLT2011]|uniref:Uncharacterized protein n=1 Tax=Christiangramia flava JLT2011 TaxID=1229726 RepID=A0A1L7I9Q7_9FLAO|nr:hypothetical protein GRFL_3586 [Christiangramia flava JLT2011]OSS37554.1 hypothetical protein C723_3525 [Christiangramia flava JLT2011]
MGKTFDKRKFRCIFALLFDGRTEIQKGLIIKNVKHLL